VFEALVNRLYWRFYLHQAIEIAERVEKLVDKMLQLPEVSKGQRQDSDSLVSEKPEVSE